MSNLDDLISRYGSQAALAKACGVHPVNVSHWRKRGIPARHLAKLTPSPASDAPPSSDGVPLSVSLPGEGIYCDEP